MGEGGYLSIRRKPISETIATNLGGESRLGCSSKADRYHLSCWRYLSVRNGRRAAYGGEQQKWKGVRGVHTGAVACSSQCSYV